VSTTLPSDRSSSDAAAVRRVLAGEREEYAHLISAHQEPLYRHALGMVGDADAAADLVQDSFIKAYTSLGTCEDPAMFRSWIFRILRNRCLDYLKNRRRQDVPLEAGTFVAIARENPASDLERTETASAIHHALSTLPEAQREAFLLKHVEGQSYEEIAEISGSSISALKMRVKRAREALQEALGGRKSGDVTEYSDRSSVNGQSFEARTDRLAQQRAE
jgi:RNA polymerase sigma-70 factor, ECF subfamily